MLESDWNIAVHWQFTYQSAPANWKGGQTLKLHWLRNWQELLEPQKVLYPFLNKRKHRNIDLPQAPLVSKFQPFVWYIIYKVICFPHMWLYVYIYPSSWNAAHLPFLTTNYVRNPPFLSQIQTFLAHPSDQVRYTGDCVGDMACTWYGYVPELGGGWEFAVAAASTHLLQNVCYPPWHRHRPNRT